MLYTVGLMLLDNVDQKH